LLIILIKEILYPKNFNKWQIITAILSLYPTIGFAFGFFYSTDHGLNTNAKIQFDYIYFSFIALSTIGFGDIYPISVLSKILVSIEGFLSFVLFGIFVSGAFGIPKEVYPIRARLLGVKRRRKGRYF
jgi:Ion channel